MKCGKILIFVGNRKYCKFLFKLLSKFSKYYKIIFQILCDRQLSKVSKVSERLSNRQQQYQPITAVITLSSLLTAQRWRNNIIIKLLVMQLFNSFVVGEMLLLAAWFVCLLSDERWALWISDFLLTLDVLSTWK